MANDEEYLARPDEPPLPPPPASGSRGNPDTSAPPTESGTRRFEAVPAAPAASPAEATGPADTSARPTPDALPRDGWPDDAPSAVTPTEPVSSPESAYGPLTDDAPARGGGDEVDGPAWTAMQPVVGETAAVAESGEETEVDVVTALTALRDEVSQRLDALQKAITHATALQERQAAMVQQLHAENQILRRGELTQALKPFIVDVARLHDDVERVISHGGEELSKAAPIPEFILDVLDRHGVNQIRPENGDSFDSKLHQGLKVAPTSDESLDGKVESVIRAGFIRDDAHLVRPAQVVVYRYTSEAPPGPPLSEPPGSGPSAAPTTINQAGSIDVG